MRASDTRRRRAVAAPWSAPAPRAPDAAARLARATAGAGTHLGHHDRVGSGRRPVKPRRKRRLQRQGDLVLRDGSTAPAMSAASLGRRTANSPDAAWRCNTGWRRESPGVSSWTSYRRGSSMPRSSADRAVVDLPPRHGPRAARRLRSFRRPRRGQLPVGRGRRRREHGAQRRRDFPRGEQGRNRVSTVRHAGGVEHAEHARIDAEGQLARRRRTGARASPRARKSCSVQGGRGAKTPVRVRAIPVA